MLKATRIIKLGNGRGGRGNSQLHDSVCAVDAIEETTALGRIRLGEEGGDACHLRGRQDGRLEPAGIFVAIEDGDRTKTR